MKRFLLSTARTIGGRIRRLTDIIGAALNRPANDNRFGYVSRMTSLSSHRQSARGLPMRRR